MADIIRVAGLILQDSADQKKTYTINTNLGILDQKTVWRLKGMHTYFQTSQSAAASAAWFIGVSLARKADKDLSSWSDESIIDTSVMFRHGAAGGTIFNPEMRMELVQDVLVANSQLFLTLQSGQTGIANAVQFRLFYEETKVSELEFLRAQAPYCVC